MQLPSKKRSREDDECDQEVIQIALELGSTFGKGIDVKLMVWDVAVVLLLPCLFDKVSLNAGPR